MPLESIQGCKFRFCQNTNRFPLLQNRLAALKKILSLQNVDRVDSGQGRIDSGNLLKLTVQKQTDSIKSRINSLGEDFEHSIASSPANRLHPQVNRFHMAVFSRLPVQTSFLPSTILKTSYHLKSSSHSQFKPLARASLSNIYSTSYPRMTKGINLEATVAIPMVDYSVMAADPVNHGGYSNMQSRFHRHYVFLSRHRLAKRTNEASFNGYLQRQRIQRSTNTRTEPENRFE
ncbi:hypothetical protein PIB30_083901 [Stylosanthes scabra]|uniref:Uncharacterized protein n=1 Tax=Stylosanthes scabra TaxID=79078 RepID=A0ABU6VS83_9FABA|nr:hypothetical protein [Stylosanthes scabra]